jgi:hypothetical protein
MDERWRIHGLFMALTVVPDSAYRNVTLKKKKKNVFMSRRVREWLVVGGTGKIGDPS